MTYDTAAVMSLGFAHSCSVDMAVSSFGASVTLCIQHFVKGYVTNKNFWMFLSMSASLGLRSSTAVHVSENPHLLDLLLLLWHFSIPLLSSQEAKLVFFLN